jgi:hypothetical protein
MVRKVIGHDPVPVRLKWLEPVIKMWTKVHSNYADNETDDALYWYNERPNIGALAAAAWKTNMCAVEEYTAMKRHHITDKKSGRIDLYISNDHTSACIEAKQCWVSPGTRPVKFKETMTAALRDAKRDDDGFQKIGAVFYVMKIKATVDTINEKMLKSEVERVRETKPDALAWCFPKATRLLESSRPENEGFVWPGVIMALKVT